jgi:hypothetical protein
MNNLCLQKYGKWIRLSFTFDGKNNAFLKSFKWVDIMNVPRNKIIDIRKTSGMYVGVAQPGPDRVPLKS